MKVNTVFYNIKIFYTIFIKEQQKRHKLKHYCLLYCIILYGTSRWN